MGVKGVGWWGPLTRVSQKLELKCLCSAFYGMGGKGRERSVTVNYGSKGKKVEIVSLLTKRVANIGVDLQAVLCSRL